MTSASSAITALRRIKMPMLPVHVVDADELREVLSSLDQAIDASTSSGSGAGTGGLDITKAPYSADKAGVGDCSPVLATALAQGHRRIWFPPGVYRFSTSVSVPVDTVLTGAGSEHTKIVAQGSYWISGQYRTGGDGTPNAARIRISGFHVSMANGGILLYGHENRIFDMRFSGGAPGQWCIEMRAANECAIGYLQGGYGVDPADALSANGIIWYATTIENTINYGDGLIIECSFKGNVDNWVGLSLQHNGNHATRGVINNISVIRCQFQAPGSGSDPLSNPYDTGSVRVKNGSIGVRLDAVARCTFIGVDVEASFYGFYARGRSTGLGGRATKRNNFIGCQGFNTRHGFYAEVPDDGSVGQNHFIACQEVQPLLPVAFANGDPNDTYLGRASAHDWWLPNALWFARPGNGVPKVAVRCSDGEHLYIVHDYREPSRASGTQYPYDAAPKYKTPRKALGIDVSSGLNVARLFRPQGFVAENSLSGTTNDGTAPGAPRKDSRIVIGNGYGFSVDGTPVNPLHRVEIADPLYITEWSTPLVTTYGGDTPGIVANARQESVIGTSQGWRGPGPYANLRIPGSTGFEWQPLFEKPGWRLCQFARSGSSYTVDRTWFGKLVEHTGAATITIPADLIHADEQTTASGHSAGRYFVIKSGINAVTLQAGSGVTMYVAGSASSVSSWTMPTPASFAIVQYARTGASTARVDIVPIGSGSGGGFGGVSHTQITIDDTGSLGAGQAWLGSSGSSLITRMLVFRHSTPSTALTVPMLESGAAIGRVWTGRTAEDQTGSVTITAPTGGTINGRGAIGVAPRGGRIEIECTSDAPGATRYQAWGDIVLPNISTNTTWELYDTGVERKIVTSGVLVTVPTSFRGEASVFCAASSATLRINGSTDIALTAGDVATFRGDGTTTYCYRADPTVS